MATFGQLRDEYVITTRLDDQVSAGAAAAGRKLDQFQASAEKAAAALAATNQAVSVAGLQFSAVVQPITSYTKRASEAHTTNEQFAGSTKAVQFAMRDLGLQSIDLFQGLATGQPVFRTLIQQGAQVIQVNQAMGVSFRQTAAGIGSFIASMATNPIVLFTAAAAAVVGAIVAVGAASETTARQQLALQNSLRATREDYVKMAAEVKAAAKEIAATTSISTADARAAGGAIASAPNFTGTQAQLVALIKTSADLAAVMGKAVPEAAEQMAKALQDPGAVAKTLADQHFPAMSQALAYSIKLMADSGDKAGAFAKVMDAIRVTTGNAREQGLTPLQQAIAKLSEAFTSAGQNGRSLADALGTFITDAAAAAVRAITSVINAINTLRGLVPQFGGSIPGASSGSTSSNVVTPDSRLRTDIAQQLYAIAEQRNFGGTAELSALQADFATRVAQQESGGIQSKISSAGAIGVMQLLPSTAAGLGVNANDQGENITGGLKYIADLWSKYGGNPALVAMAYNWGPGNVDAFLAGTKAISQVPTETQNYVKAIAGTDVGSIVTGKGLGGANAGGLGSVPPGSAPAAAGQTYGAGNAGLINDAFSAYLGSGVLSLQQAQNRAGQNLLQQGIAGASAVGDTDTVKKLSEALADLKGKETDLITEQEKLARSAADSTKALSEQSGFTRTMAEVEQQFAKAAERSGHAVDEKALAMAKASAQVKLSTDFSDSVEAANRVADAQLRINAAYDGSAKSLVEAQNQEKAYARALLDFDQKSPDFAKHVDDYTAALNRGSDATLALQQHQAALQEVASSFTQAFDQISQAITTSLLSGTGAAINWGNVMKAVAQQVLAEFLKLAVLNPLLNSLFNQTNPTLGGVIGALSGSDGIGAGSAGGSSGGGFGIGQVATIGGAADKLSGGYLSNSIFGSSGSSSGGGLFSGVGEFFLGQSATQANTAGLIAGGFGSTGGSVSAGTGGVAGVVDAAPTSGLIGTGGTLGYGASAVLGTAAGIGGGIGLGSFAGGAIASSLGKASGPNPMIGAAIGAAVGAIFGPVGALIGGLIGGAGGGFIGPKPKTPFAATAINVTDSGQLAVGQTNSQLVSVDLAGIAASINSINQVLTANNLRVSGATATAQSSFYGNANTAFFLGGGKAKGPNIVDDIGAGLDRVRFQSDDPVANQFYQAHGFGDIETFAKAASALTQFLKDVRAAGPNASGEKYDPGTFFGSQLGNTTTPSNLPTILTAVDLFVTQTVPALDKLGTVSGSLNDAIASLTTQFQPAIDFAHQLGYAEQDLIAVRDKAIAKLQADAVAQFTVADQGFTSRYLNAAASISGNPADAQAANLYAFDVGAEAQRKQLSDALVSVWGDAVKSTENFGTQMGILERTLGEERLAITQAANDQLLAQARSTGLSTVQSITQYVRSIQTGAASPLSPQDQLSLAQSQFNAVSGAAMAGDANSLSQVTSFAGTLQNAARAVYGSGQDYVAVFNDIVDKLTTISAISPDTLTASIFAAETRAQTSALEDALGELKGELQTLRAQMAAASAAPARLAAA